MFPQAPTIGLRAPPRRPAPTRGFRGPGAPFQAAVAVAALDAAPLLCRGAVLLH
ncbi:hypothetical protein [Streptomyces sp. WMMC1477]|uniref:hypothetical protein n=1 Tax=Streptomyces sp. WMMC1477 TaxID=3015155 RepID=UPI0022B71B96|nr:hypothetical protein [Streptomyces sp. WMMC1477]MCZ7430206.1 hypothetical protein [Streptomyces sp. WMMC1477]